MRAAGAANHRYSKFRTLRCVHNHRYVHRARSLDGRAFEFVRKCVTPPTCQTPLTATATRTFARGRRQKSARKLCRGCAQAKRVRVARDHAQAPRAHPARTFEIVRRGRWRSLARRGMRRANATKHTNFRAATLSHERNALLCRKCEHAEPRDSAGWYRCHMDLAHGDINDRPPGSNVRTAQIRRRYHRKPR